MTELIVTAVFWVGAAVCLLGGVGIAALLAVWAIDRVAYATKTTWIIARWWAERRRSKRFPG